MSSPMQQQENTAPAQVVLAAHLKKLKTLKKKYFVLRAEAPGRPACLEYYDSKKKYDARQPPKRSISVRSCFNINRRRDTKHKHVIALYTKDDCFCLVLDNEKDLEEWLNALLLLQIGDQPDGEQPRPTFEHVWQVVMQKKGLGERMNMLGPYRLCLTDQSVSLLKQGTDSKAHSIEFSLSSVRRSGSMDRIFYIEVGRSVVSGGGEFWMEVEDCNIASNMHNTINNASTKLRDMKEEGPRPRVRSSSANEASKPISVLQRRHTAQKLHSFSPLEEQRMLEEQVAPLKEQNIPASAPSQCSQSQTTTSSNTHTAGIGVTDSGTLGTNVYTKSSTVTANRRRHSVASHPVSSVNNNKSQFNHASASSSSTTSTTSTATISHQRTLSLPLAAVAINQTQSSKRSVLRCPPTLRDSKVLAYSPPVVSSVPISPASAACSTDSAGSSLSMDDASEHMEEGLLSKYGHSLTPDEPVILEENSDDYVPWSASHQQHKYSPSFKSCSPSQQSSYVEMYSPCSSSPGRGAYMPMSPATGAHSHSRTSSLVEETCTNSGITVPDGYVPMAPAASDDGYVDMDRSSHHNHNGHFPDDMSSQHDGSSCSVTSGTPSTDLRFSEYHLDKVTSFLAPGEDLQNQARPTRAYSVGSRPEPANRHRKNRLEIAQEVSRVRAFSVGSRYKKPEIGRLVNVVTAPLVGGIEKSQSSKSNSAPLLSSSWGHTSACSATSERMEDLMELDFTKPRLPVTLSSPPSSYSQSQSYSTTTDTSSYVDMSPGQPPIAATATYGDINGPAKVSSLLKPVEETESAYMQMDGPMEDWSQPRISPKQVPSPCQEDYMQMNGPPGVTRTAPMDLPQPRRPPEGYVEMSFKAKPSLDQDYTNMSLGAFKSARRHHHHHHHHNHNNNRKKKCSLPIAIQAGAKFSKTPNFLPLSDSPTSESMESTPASPPRATPTGSSSTIFPFSLNSPQSPIKPFNAVAQSNANEKAANAADPVSKSGSGSVTTAPTTRKIAAPSPLPGVDGCPSSKKPHDNLDSHISTNSSSKHGTLSGKLSNLVSTVSNIGNKEALRVITNTAPLTQEGTTHPLSPITKKLSDLTVSKPKLVTASTTTSPTPSGFKPPGATLLHYASLDLPEVAGVPPTSPTPVQEGFSYAEIDFAKLKQN
ncbi:hypothetical protein QAD02_023112 [Eretmocerus hayati]|uniref:Uncharacterized protein n=1 Tax=Eretmocerus hayati TaxID=131215 RepID=A0ACC2PW11_9HYME|nr:hypothetical protein QAD02_023112 [Eretmocerus hayati]